MKNKKVFAFMVVGALLLILGATMAKSAADFYIEKAASTDNDNPSKFVLTMDTEDRFDALIYKARRSPSFIKDIAQFDIDIDDFDSDMITGVDEYYVTCILDNGYTVKLGESEVEVKYQIFKEVSNE